MDLQRLDRLAFVGGLQLWGDDPWEAHREYDEWCRSVCDWLSQEAPGSGLTAEWMALGVSPLIVGGQSYDQPETWLQHQGVVEARLKWLADLPLLMGRNADHLGSGGFGTGAVVPPDFERSVFLNIPFDDEFRPLRDAAVFALVFLGYHVRCALDTVDGTRVRIEKLYDLIRSSRLGIHDLSRTALDEANQFPRFNMPLELGIFLGVKDSGGTVQRRKNALVTSSEPYDYQKYISDVAGQDVAPHGDDPRELVGLIRDWLGGQAEGHLPTRSRVWERYRQFRTELEASCRSERQTVDELTYRDFLRHVDEFCSTTGHDLLLGNNRRIQSPRRAEIASVIGSLPGGLDSFAILRKSGSGLSFMQTAGGGDEPYVLEVQEGSTDAHYLCTTPELDANGVARALSLYAEDDETWRAQFDWERIDLISRST